MTVNINYQRNGRTVYSGTTFAGHVFILNGVKPGQYSFSLNLRWTNIEPGAPVRTILGWAVGLVKDSALIGATRQLFEEADTYEEAKEFLSTVPLITPVYYILGGVSENQGCIITRSAKESIKLQTLEVSSDKPTWILKTNYDHWMEPPANDDRRNPGNFCMKKNSRVSFEALFNVLTCNKVLIQEVVFTALMDAKLGKMETYTRSCPAGVCDPGPEILSRTEL